MNVDHRQQQVNHEQQPAQNFEMHSSVSCKQGRWSVATIPSSNSNGNSNRSNSSRANKRSNRHFWKFRIGSGSTQCLFCPGLRGPDQSFWRWTCAPTNPRCPYDIRLKASSLNWWTWKQTKECSAECTWSHSTLSQASPPETTTFGPPPPDFVLLSPLLGKHWENTLSPNSTASSGVNHARSSSKRRNTNGNTFNNGYSIVADYKCIPLVVTLGGKSGAEPPEEENT